MGTDDFGQIEYRTESCHEALTNGWPNAQATGDDDWGAVVYRFEGGKPVEPIGWDGGEPEDQTLWRDWSWVAPALQAAYELGRSHGAT